MNTTIRTKLCTVIYCVLGTAALGAVSTSVNATDDPPSKTVKFHDLDIAKEEGAKALYDRIRVAAQEVCALSAGTDPIQRVGVQGCIRAAVDKAIKDVNAPMLTHLRFGGSGDVRLASK